MSFSFKMYYTCKFFSELLCLQCFLLVTSYVLVAGVVNPWTLIAIIPLSVLFFLLRHYYLRTSRQVQRLEGTTRSPVVTHVSASLQGLHTIRAFGAQDKFIKEFDNHQDLHTEARFLFLATSRWLAVRLDWINTAFVISVSFTSVFAATDLDAGSVGFSLTYAMTLIILFQWMVRQSSLVENQMVSVERVLEYSELLSEAQLETDEEQKPPRDWPQQGEIISRNVCLKYSEESPYILRDLSFTIRPREKIGVIGRTGAGKSSLIAMFTRLAETEGEIFIDDINIKNLGLHELRNNISLIPQDPVLFTGTLRRNLDPFESHNDISLWKVLAEVKLKPIVEALLHGLDTEVAEGGTNFSVGQRQLICLARAILKHNKILIIDEATANVDPRTDQVIQKTIRKRFQDCTVFTIAHRLYTVMDSDRLLVLDEGRLVEFDSPYLLLQSCDSFLHRLVKQMGNEAANELLQIAKSAYQQKNRHETDSDKNVILTGN